MTPEQEANLFTTQGAVLSTLKDIQGDTKLLREVINGNGHPEEGMVYRVAMLEHKQKECNIAQVAVDVFEIKTNLKVSAAENWGARLWAWARSKPQFSVPLTIAVLSSMGFPIIKLVNALVMIREIGEKLGLKP